MSAISKKIAKHLEFGAFAAVAAAGVIVRSMANDEIEGIVLRSVRYGEADAVLTIYSRERGRVSAIAKGARRPKSRIGAAAQPGVRIEVTLHRGRGSLATVRQAAIVEPNAGLWTRADRLQAAGCMLETVYQVLPEEDPSPEGYALLGRALALLSRAESRGGPARLHPLVLGLRAKLLVVSGLLPRLGPCASCAPDAQMVAFSSASGGALCGECARLGTPVPPSALSALAALVGRPLAEAPEAVEPDAAQGVETAIVDVLEHGLDVRLRSVGTGGGGASRVDAARG